MKLQNIPARHRQLTASHAAEPAPAPEREAYCAACGRTTPHFVFEVWGVTHYVCANVCDVLHGDCGAVHCAGARA